MKLYKPEDRAKIYKQIWKYKQRREEKRKKFGVVNGRRAPEEYKIAVHNINNKIRNWEKSIRMIDKRNNQMIAIANHIAYFSGINVKNSVNYTSQKHKLARNIFYKFGLENGIPATCLASYVGATRGDTVARGRKRFTKTFSTHPENKQKWLNFKNYYEEDIRRNCGH